jgi:hypothetical protein
VGLCKCGFFNVWLCVSVGFVTCGCVLECVFDGVDECDCELLVVW